MTRQHLPHQYPVRIDVSLGRRRLASKQFGCLIDEGASGQQRRRRAGTNLDNRRGTKETLLMLASDAANAITTTAARMVEDFRERLAAMKYRTAAAEVAQLAMVADVGDQHVRGFNVQVEDTELMTKLHSRCHLGRVTVAPMEVDSFTVDIIQYLLQISSADVFVDDLNKLRKTTINK